jgi:transposase InsO family protein
MTGADEIDDRRRQLALFRHAVIAELDAESLPRGELSARIEHLSRARWKLPSGSERRFSTRTLWQWWSDYKKGGLEGLLPESRQSGPREITPELLEAAIGARKEIPSRSTATIIDLLELQGLAPPGKLKRSTLDRHLRAAGCSRRILKTLGDKVFTRLLFERPNQFWVGDYHEAPILWDPQRQLFLTVHLSAFLDHFSKVCVHGRWYRNEQIATLDDTLKKAFLTRGLCDKLYVDNGPSYRSGDFAFACEHLGVRMVHSRAYASEARGLIERFNRTISDGFEPEARAARIDSLVELNLCFEAWLERRYHLVPHGTTGQPPLDRFAQPGFTPRYPDPVLVSDIFRVRVKRRVHPKTATVEVAGHAFQCESFLRNRWVRVYYDPFDCKDVLVFLNGKRVQRAFPQKVNSPQPTPERPVASPPSFDYLGALRAEFDRRIALQARHLSLSSFQPSADFTLKPFLDLCAQMLGKELSPYEKEELTRSFNGVGPFAEKTVRLSLEHALKLRGRGLHVSVYSHYLKHFHLAALKANQE